MCCFVHVCVYTLMIYSCTGETSYRGKKTFFMLYSTEYEISTVHKN